YFDYGRFFARVDTFGVRTLPLGHGTLELVARVSQEGFLAQHAGVAAAQRRSNPVPVGLGSFQETPLGGFFVYGFADLASGGALAEATYAAEFKLARLTVYPTAGLEWRSQRYVRHLYGIPASEAGAAAALPYAPGASLAPNLGMALEVPLGGSWFINGQWRRRWFDSAVSASPLVQQATQDSAFIALSYRFK
ncbi:MAG: MipA/OmpV family protein, partial [Janthinobacterium lividum]